MTDYLRLRQVCLASSTIEQDAADIGAIFGLRICHRDPRVMTFGVENVLFVVDSTFIEIVAPIEPGTAAGRFLDRKGGLGGYIAIFDCLDPDAYAKHANEMGVSTTYEIDRPGVYRCIQLHPRDCWATMLEFDRTYGGESLTGLYSPAGEGWQAYVDTTVTRAITGIEAISPRADALAERWGAILRRPVAREGDGAVIHVDGADVRVAPSDGAERLETILLNVADPAAVMAEAERRGRATGANEIRVAGMAFRIAKG